MPIQAILAMVAGIVILLAPRLLNYAIAIYLLAVGVMGLLFARYGHTVSPQVVISLVAGLLILIAYRMVDRKSMARILRSTRGDAAIMICWVAPTLGKRNWISAPLSPFGHRATM